MQALASSIEQWPSDPLWIFLLYIEKGSITSQETHKCRPKITNEYCHYTNWELLRFFWENVESTHATEHLLQKLFSETFEWRFK